MVNIVCFYLCVTSCSFPNFILGIFLCQRFENSFYCIQLSHSTLIKFLVDKFKLLFFYCCFILILNQSHKFSLCLKEINNSYFFIFNNTYLHSVFFLLHAYFTCRRSHAYCTNTCYKLVSPFIHLQIILLGNFMVSLWPVCTIFSFSNQTIVTTFG